MKILVLSDIHSKIENLKKLMKKAESMEIELILIAGDLTNFGGKTQAKEALGIIKKINKKMLAVPGNLDSKEIISFLEKENISLHQRKERFQEFTFIGFGGATKCIGTIVFGEEEIYRKLKELIEKEKKVFLLTHSPPKNSFLDKSFSGNAIGSDAIKKIIEEFSPEFSASGHCHESFGEEKIGTSFCINAGAVKDGKMALIDTEKKEVKRIELWTKQK